jgi:ADP-ribose pyrophosphatase
MKPEILSTETIYEGKIFDIRLDKIREGEVRYEREIVEHNGSAVIVPVFEDKTIALVRQYRHAAGKYLLEIPAGSLEKGELPEICAHRELEEEVGVKAETLEKLIEFYVSPGFVSEKMHVFLAANLTEIGQKLEADELIEIERYSFEKAFEMIRSGEIQDAKSIIGLITAGAKSGFVF